MQQAVDHCEERLEEILFELEDYQITHGSLLKIPRSLADFDSPTGIARPIGVSIIPTVFPRPQFEQALNIQELFNELYVKVSEDEIWLQNTIRNLGEVDEFAAKLWSIWERVRGEGEIQPLRCGIFRSDYMLHYDYGDNTQDRHLISDEQTRRMLLTSQLKQVEFNTYSCAGGTHAAIVANMHRYLAGKGIHRAACLPKNDSIASIVKALEVAHRAYGSPRNRTAILMTVQPDNVNICDERPIEYALSECDPPIVLYRVEYSGEVIQRCRLGPNRELLFQPSAKKGAVEISVVYQRAGYDPYEYNQQGVEARLILERSRAIKCPTILAHISGFKKVQQELARPGTLERFLTPEKASVLRPTFVPQYPVDMSTEGMRAREMALHIETAKNHILKPSLEGGGHNIHGKDIPAFLKAVPAHHWSKYVLMEMIHPPSINGVLASPIAAYKGLVISELGVIGTCLWRRNERCIEKAEILGNFKAGWTFKTKPHDVKEMSVVKGHGCFDCPNLV